jgi:hypothetical protein
MATNLGTAAAFTTANMKPAPGEQVDAIWGQNIADNTGHLYFRKLPGPCFGCSPQQDSSAAGTYRGTHFFEKANGMATFYGSFIGTASTGNPSITVGMNGTSLFSQNASGTLYSLTIGTDLVGVADGQMVEVGWRMVVPSGSGECNFAFTGWQRP